MRGGTLVGTLAFGAVAALGAVAWVLLSAPVLGPSWAAALYSLAAAVLYVVVIAPSLPRGVAIGGLALLLAALVGVLASQPAYALAGAAQLLSVCRSGFLYRGRPARALVLEATLGVGGLLFAQALAAPTPLGVGLAVWGFFLVQSLFFLAGGVRERQVEGPQVDPFERARKEALALLEEV